MIGIHTVACALRDTYNAGWVYDLGVHTARNIECAMSDVRVECTVSGVHVSVLCWVYM